MPSGHTEPDPYALKAPTEPLFARFSLPVFLSLLLLSLCDTIVIAQSAGDEWTFGRFTLPLASVVMLGFVAGALLAVMLETAHSTAAVFRSQGSWLAWAPGACVAGGGLLLMLWPLFQETTVGAKVAAAVLVGMPLPRLFSLLARCGSLPFQALALASAHALGEICALMLGWLWNSLDSAVLHREALLFALPLTALGGLLRCLPPPPPASASTDGNDVPTVTRRDMAALVLAVLLFFLLHATHDYAFRLYAFINQGPPLWLKLGLRLTFPLLALMVPLWGLMPLAALSLALSALAPALDFYPGTTISYWTIFVADSIGLHGGLFFFILSFGRMAQRSPLACLLCCLPSLSLYLTFGGMGIFNANIEADPLAMLLACLVMLGLLTALFVFMQQRWTLLLGQQEDLPADPPETPGQTGPLSDAAITAFALVHGISPRETQVLRLLCDGLSYAQIAERLYIAENTIKIHVSRLLRKTDSKSRSQLLCKLVDPQRQRAFPS